MTQSRSFLLPAPPPEPDPSARSDGWGLRLASRTACLAIGGLLAVGFAGQMINDDQNAPYWPLFVALAGQAIGVVASWATEGWRLLRDGRRWLGAALFLLGPVIAAITGGLSWIVSIWALYVMS